MARHPAAWLLRELPQLEREQLLDADTAARLRSRYAPLAGETRSLGAPLSALLGAALIGLGLILLIAHNWDRWPLGLRLLCAALPLAFSQLACVHTLRRRADSRSWREASAVLTACSSAALLALVAQIFHFRGDLYLYLLSCLALALPLVYLLRSELLAALLMPTALGVMAAMPESLRQPWQALGLFGLLAPHLWQLARRAPDSLSLSLLVSLWSLMLAITLSLSIVPLRAYGWLWCAQLAGLLLLVDALSPGLQGLAWRPLRAAGELLWAIVALASSYPEFWTQAPRAGSGLVQANVLLQLALPLLAVLAILALRGRHYWAVAAALLAAPLAILQGWPTDAEAGGLALLMNCYVLGMAVARITHGLRSQALREISTGLTLLAALLLLRFFGSEWPFVLRGLAFMLVGAGFLLAHAWLRRRMRAS